MPITIDWVDETRRNILLLRFTEDWNWLEFRQAAREVQSLIRSQPQPVDVIVDLQACASFARFDGMTHIWAILRERRLPRPSYFVLISLDPNMRVLASVIRHSQPHLRQYLVVVDSEADAHAALAHYRA